LFCIFVCFGLPMPFSLAKAAIVKQYRFHDLFDQTISEVDFVILYFS